MIAEFFLCCTWWMLLLLWPCTWVWFLVRWGGWEEVLVPSTRAWAACWVLPGPVCIVPGRKGGLRSGCSIELKFRNGYRAVAANHLMVRLAENNLCQVVPAVWCYWLVLPTFSTHWCSLSPVLIEHMKVQRGIWRGQFILQESQWFLLCLHAL